MHAKSIAVALLLALGTAAPSATTSFAAATTQPAGLKITTSRSAMARLPRLVSR